MWEMARAARQLKRVSVSTTMGNCNQVIFHSPTVSVAVWWGLTWIVSMVVHDILYYHVRLVKRSRGRTVATRGIALGGFGRIVAFTTAPSRINLVTRSGYGVFALTGPHSRLRIASERWPRRSGNTERLRDS